VRTTTVNPPLLAILGPTASGKSALALRLAKKFQGAVISADSQQIYRHAKIGTNQPAGRWRIANGKWQIVTGKKGLYWVENIPHFFIDILPPTKQFSAAQFQTQTNALCQKLSTVGILPIMTGGTGLYISAIVEGYNFPRGKPNLGLRQRLGKLSTGTLQHRLKSLDWATYKVIDRHNRRRLIRALEHVIATETSLSQNQLRQRRPNTLTIGLKIDKSKLRKIITARTKKMLRTGLIKETRHLRKKYPHSPLLESIGYREVADFLNGKINQTQTEQQIINHTWQYARRQMTWFKKMPGVHWIKSFTQAERLAKNFLGKA